MRNIILLMEGVPESGFTGDAQQAAAIAADSGNPAEVRRRAIQALAGRLPIDELRLASPEQHLATAENPGNPTEVRRRAIKALAKSAIESLPHNRETA